MQPLGQRRLVIVVAIILTMATACSRQAEAPISTANPPPNVVTSSAVSTTVAASTATSGPLTEAETSWLEGVSQLGKKMDKVLTDSPANVTPSVMRSLARQLAGCAQALNRLGPPTERLKAIAALAGQGCSAYETGSKCFATAAAVGIPLSGSADARKQTKALDCGFAAQGKGIIPFSTAEGEILNLKVSAGT
jgi:hypothetical protein